MSRSIFWSAVLVCFLLIITACSESSENNIGPEEDTNAGNGGGVHAEDDGSGDADGEPEEVTITIAYRHMSEEQALRWIVEPAQQKYPWITVNLEPVGNIEERTLAGDIPDIIIANNVNAMPQLDENGWLTSINDLIEAHNVDLSRFQPVTLDALRTATGRDYLVGLPYYQNFYQTVYNKDIFDLFGVSYPSDGITWEEITDLARELTREEDGVQYHGLMPNVPERLAAQLSQGWIDSESMRADLTNENWQRVMQQMSNIYGIPGNIGIVHYDIEPFVVDQNVAMFTTTSIIANDAFTENADMWDIVSFPVWPDAPGLRPMVDGHYMVITSASEHPEDALRVILSITSDDVQQMMAREGRMTILEDTDIEDIFAADLEHTQDKNLQAAFATTPAPSYTATLYDAMALDETWIALEEIVIEGRDILEALRDAEQRINNNIEDMEGQ